MCGQTNIGPRLMAYPNNKYNKTASFQNEAMRTQVALWFSMKWNLYK